MATTAIPEFSGHRGRAVPEVTHSGYCSFENDLKGNVKTLRVSSVRCDFQDFWLRGGGECFRGVRWI